MKSEYRTESLYFDENGKIVYIGDTKEEVFDRLKYANSEKLGTVYHEIIEYGEDEWNEITKNMRTDVDLLKMPNRVDNKND